MRHCKGHKVKDGALNVALSPIAICDRVASYWRGGDNASVAVGCEGDEVAKVDHHSIRCLLLCASERTRYGQQFQVNETQLLNS